jgi:hypothetical protein
MKVLIKKTEEIKELYLLDEKSGVNHAGDFIGNLGATADGQFEWDRYSGLYISTQETFDWWDKILLDRAALWKRVEGMKKLYDVEEIEAIINLATEGVDLEDEVAKINKALDLEFGDNSNL